MDFKAIAEKWQKEWEEAKAFKVSEDPKKPKYYCLEMLPYPSASYLHMGHVRNYTIGDVIARYKRMKGFNILYPMGYDSFGLPAENAAKKAGIHPKEYTEKAIAKIIEFQKQLGNSYDWDRVLATHTPEYFKWNQFFFLKFMEKGLVYRKMAPVNWCPSCNSVLANEEVVDGKCWRHEDTEVGQKELEQWFLRTTKYADELLEGLNDLGWSDTLKLLQRNWISRKEWIDIDYEVEGTGKNITVSTTRPDTNFGATFVVISPEHSFISKEAGMIPAEYRKSVDDYIVATKKKTEEERMEEGGKKTGVFTGLYCINQLTGKKMPLWVTDFVLTTVGTGVVVGVPGHDLRDFDFAKEFGLPIVRVVVSKDGDASEITKREQVQEEEGVMINSGFLNGMNINDATKKVMDYLEEKGWGRRAIRYRLRDWLISRQRYWGTPIPIVYCGKCGLVPLKEQDLPLKLPETVDFKKEGNPLNHVKDWVETSCPKCKGSAKRETDTMGGFMDSSWYFLRYCSPQCGTAPFDRKAVDYWMPVDQYIGGIEHAVGHLIYARFFTKALRDMGYLKVDEPFTNLFNQGIVYKDGHKMSKSFGNTIVQDEIANKYGIDTARLFLMSVASPESAMEWSDQGVEGSFRLLQKIAKTTELNMQEETDKDRQKKNIFIKNFTNEINQFRFNLAIIELRSFTDHLNSSPNKEGFKVLIQLISPFVPHLAEELWEQQGYKGFVSLSQWPEAGEIDPAFLVHEKLVEQVKVDVAQVLKLVKVNKPKKITLFISPAWKYDLYKQLAKELEKSRNTGDILKAVLATDLKKYGQDITKMVPKLAQQGLPEYSSKDQELSWFQDAKPFFEKEYGCTVTVEDADQSQHPKAKQASPGKPAILVE